MTARLSSERAQKSEFLQPPEFYHTGIPQVPLHLVPYDGGALVKGAQRSVRYKAVYPVAAGTAGLPEQGELYSRMAAVAEES